MLPLHVFEPRYRRLVNDVLGGDRRFAVFLQRPDGSDAPEPPPCETGCLGEIVRADALPDGRFQLLLLGIARLRIQAFLTEVPYRVVSAALTPEEGELAPRPEERETFRALVGRYFRGVLRRPVDDELETQGLEALVNTAAANLQVDGLERQRLLEAATLAERMANVGELMDEGLTLRRLTRLARGARPHDTRLN